MSSLRIRDAVCHIDKNGMLLIFPIKNKSEPKSLWSCFYPKKKMAWEWTENADDGVVRLWHLRAELSRSGKVAYAKWYQGRATAISLDIFPSLLQPSASLQNPLAGLSQQASTLLEILEDDSPLPTKRLRGCAEMSGKENERAFNRGMRELWNNLLIVGYGEVEEGGFPSLAVGATKLLFEDEWAEAKRLAKTDAESIVYAKLGETSSFSKFYRKMVIAIEVRCEQKKAL